MEEDNEKAFKISGVSIASGSCCPSQMCLFASQAPLAFETQKFG